MKHPLAQPVRPARLRTAIALSDLAGGLAAAAAAVLVVAVAAPAAAQSSPSPFLHVDQFGYEIAAEKVAVISDPQAGYNAALAFAPGATLEVRDAATGAVAYSGAPVAYDGGATHAQSGDRGWWFDFSALRTPGTYEVVDPASGERSAAFAIGETPYNQVMYHALRMFYYNRCSTAKPEPYAAPNWTDGPSFDKPGQDTEARYLYDPANPALYRDLSGGWFDAGDYNKYVTFAEVVVHDLLSAYEENPQAFTTASDIPGSANALPDVLDEVRWELEWLLRMSNPDGSVHIKMGSISYAENALSPPSANVDPRYYGPTCTAASLAAAGMFAHAARVFARQAGQQAFAAQLQARAAACFAYALPFVQAGTLETDCDDGQIKAGDADRTPAEQIESAVTAAWYLRALTADPAYDAFLAAYVPQVQPYAGYYWSPYNSELNTALLEYIADPTTDVAVSTYLTQTLQATIDNQPFFGWGERDLYRAHIPDWAYHWGSSYPKAKMAHFNVQAARAGFTHAGGQPLERRAAEQLHYFHGVNPLGLVMLSNLYGAGAERAVDELYHGWFYDGTPWDNARTSAYGPAPGYVTGGANDFYEDLAAHDPNLVPPVGQPAQKSYLDDNNTVHSITGSDNAIYSINEPAIYYQSAYVRLLANYVAEAQPGAAVTRFEAAEGATRGTVDVAWTSAAEPSAAAYAVEHSLDATRFATVGTRQPRGAGGDYALTHADAAAGRANYYRLATTSDSGAVTYSPTRRVDLAAASGTYTGAPFGKTELTPNPARAQTELRLERVPPGTRLRIADALGRIVYERAVDGARTTIATGNLAAGPYAVQLGDGRGGHTALRLVIR